jgi:chaperone modulatory protein CbpM
MNNENYIIGVLIEESVSISFIEVCQRYNISEQLLTEMIEEGLLANDSSESKYISLNQKSLRRMESAFRLHRDLGINLPGVTLAIELLEEMEQMRHELDILRKHF